MTNETRLVCAAILMAGRLHGDRLADVAERQSYDQAQRSSSELADAHAAELEAAGTADLAAARDSRMAVQAKVVELATAPDAVDAAGVDLWADVLAEVDQLDRAGGK